MFGRLGATNAWRNLGRSMLALLSMAMAAGFFTNAMSLSRGYAHLYHADYRSLTGGEIAAYAPQLSGTVPLDGQSWQYQPPLHLENTDIDRYRPELAKRGYLSGVSETKPFTDQEIEAMATVQGVAAVYPYYRLPAYLNYAGGLRQVALHGRDAAQDTQLSKPPSELIGDGRWFTAEDDGAPVAVVSSRQHYRPGERMIGVGDTLELLLPQAITLGDGSGVTFDSSALLRVELQVIGVFDARSRVMTHDSASLQHYQLYDEIQLPLATWQQLWQLAGSGDYPVQQLSLVVPDSSYLEDTVVSLRQSFPKRSFFSVATLAESLLLPDDADFLLDIHRNIAFAQRGEAQRGLPLDMRLPMAAMIFVNAALVIASNLLILASERREEIGVLKTVGATRGNLMAMIQSEALLISLLGALGGFLIFRLPALFNQISNGISAVHLLGTLAFDLALVLGATALATVVFALLPALKTAGQTVLDAFR